MQHTLKCAECTPQRVHGILDSSSGVVLLKVKGGIANQLFGQFSGNFAVIQNCSGLFDNNRAFKHIPGYKSPHATRRPCTQTPWIACMQDAVPMGTVTMQEETDKGSGVRFFHLFCDSRPYSSGLDIIGKEDTERAAGSSLADVRGKHYMTLKKIIQESKQRELECFTHCLEKLEQMNVSKFSKYLFFQETTKISICDSETFLKIIAEFSSRNPHIVVVVVGDSFGDSSP